MSDHWQKLKKTVEEYKTKAYRQQRLKEEASWSDLKKRCLALRDELLPLCEKMTLLHRHVSERPKGEHYYTDSGPESDTWDAEAELWSAATKLRKAGEQL